MSEKFPWGLCASFFRIGLFGFGGGYAMLPLVRHELVDAHGWISANEFADLVAVSQMTPGPIIANAATWVGYASGGGVPGAALATAAVAAAPFLMMWLVCRQYRAFKTHPRVQGALAWLRPVVAGMVAAAAFSLMDASIYADPRGAAIFIGALAAIMGLKWRPIPVLALAGGAGALLY